MADAEIVELACLGRPFQLGMLYDCRRDLLIPGITLWDSATLRKNINVHQQPNTVFKVIASDSSEDKSNALNVNASLEASFLCGLVSVKGSAEYLSNKKKSKSHSRVTLQYKVITRFEQLTMDHLGVGNIQHPSVFEEGSATHVVTGILHGAHAFFIFDKEVSSSENQQDIQGQMQACIKKIPLISIEGQASLKMNEAEQQQSSTFSCTFHGDFALENNPVSFIEAIKVYSELPKLLGENGQHAVPLTAWLYPLSKLDSSAAKMIREISISLVRHAHRIINDLDDADVQCEDLLKTDMAIQFSEIRTKLKKFKELCLDFKLVFQKELCKLLPSIRGGGKEEQELAAYLGTVEKTPFWGDLISAHLNDKEKEINILRSYLEIMKGVPVFSSSNDLTKELLKPTNDYSVVFAFSSLAEEVPYVIEVENYLKGALGNSDKELSFEPSSPKAWFCGHAADKTRKHIQLFLDFKEANCRRENIAFCISSIPDNNIVSSSIHVYEKGSLLTSQFELPSKPPVPQILHIEHDCIHLEIKPPAHGSKSVESYIISYKTVQSSEWLKVNTACDSSQVIIKDLEPHKEYCFSCKAVCCAGESLASDATQFYKTRPCSPPGQPMEKCVESGALTITWDIPTPAGENVEVIGYLLEFREHTQDKKGIPWRDVKSTKRQYTLKELTNGTDYVFRVSAQCGDAGMSLPSAETVLTASSKSKKASTDCRSELFLKQSFVFEKANPRIRVLNLQERYRENEDVKRFVFGSKVEAAQNKVILVLGATGSGKTTLINAMVNYILGVRWEENYRFKLIHEVTNQSQAESQTTEVISYELYNQPGFQIPYSLTIVDTPGFGDTRGIEQDRKITEQIKNFLCSPLGIQHIDAVCFVIQASLARLTPSQKYIFDSVLTIFGKDIAENIIIMVTFADGSEILALEGIKAAEVPCKKNRKGQPEHFSFNNSAVYAQKTPTCSSGNDRENDDDDDDDNDDDDDDDDIDTRHVMNWSSNVKKMRTFFKALENMENRDLKLTIQVLEERDRLAKAMESMTEQIKAGLSKLTEIEQTKMVLKNEKGKMLENASFEQEVNKVKPIRTAANCFTMNCNSCFFTCHSTCFLPEEDSIKTCAVIGDNGKCVMCPNQCSYDLHVREKFLWTYETVTEKTTIKELRDNFMKAHENFMSAQEVQEKLNKEYLSIRTKLTELVKQSFKCLKRLNEIALKPRSLSSSEYFDVLIKREEEEKRPGFESRTVKLQQIKQECENLEKIAEGESVLP